MRCVKAGRYIKGAQHTTFGSPSPSMHPASGHIKCQTLNVSASNTWAT